MGEVERAEFDSWLQDIRWVKCQTFFNKLMINLVGFWHNKAKINEF